MKFSVVPKHNDRKEWLQWRQDGIGSSDACIIMGASRFKDRKTLLVDKSLPFIEEEENTYIKERGNKIEFQVRMFLEKKYGQEFSALNTVNTAFPFMRASLDGACKDVKTIIEIKLLSSVNPAKVNKSADGYLKWEAAKQGGVPAEYWPQVQHQLMITGAERCLFVGYKEERGNQVVTQDKLAIVVVEPNKDYIRQLAHEEFKFWYEVQERRNELVYKEGELD